MKFDKIIANSTDKTLYLDDSNGVKKCVKVFGEGYSKADVLNEALNQARIEETGLNVPRLLNVTVEDEKWAIISEYIEGKTLEELMREEPQRKNEYIGLLIELQMDIHSRSCPLLNKQKDKMIRKLAETDFDATTRYDLHNRLESMPKHRKICHGDLTPSNIIIDGNGTPYIVDWSHATYGNASADVARTYLMFWMNGDISGAELYLDTFCQRSNTEKGYVKAWMPIVAAAQSVGCRDEEREFLMSWVNDANRY